MKVTTRHREHCEPRTSARATAAGAVCLAILLTVSLAILLAELVTSDTGSLLLAAGVLVAVAATLVLSLPLLDRLPAPRPRPVTPSRVTSSPRPVRQPVTR